MLLGNLLKKTDKKSTKAEKGKKPSKIKKNIQAKVQPKMRTLWVRRKKKIS
mgnify:CR=1 FL=1